MTDKVRGIDGTAFLVGKVAGSNECFLVAKIRREGEDAQDVVLGYSQPSLTGLFVALMWTQD